MMNIYSTRMLASYDEDRKIFLDMFKLPEKKQQALAEKVFREVSKIVQEFENLEEPNWFQRKLNNAYKISEEQDYLDKLLKTALPIVWNHIDLFKKENWKKEEFLKMIPDGKEDASGIVHKGMTSIYLEVWKDCNLLKFRFQKDTLSSLTKKLNAYDWSALSEREQKTLAEKIKLELELIFEMCNRVDIQDKTQNFQDDLDGLLEIALPIIRSQRIYITCL